MQFFIRLSRWLAANASLFIIAIAVLTFFVPDLFVWVRGTTQTVILGIIMLTMGLTLTTHDFEVLARRPHDILIGACAQFFIMPCVAYVLVKVFHLEPALALGILLVGCCPGGVSSRNDLRFYPVGSRNDTIADGAHRRSDYRDRLHRNVPEYPYCYHYSRWNRLFP